MNELFGSPISILDFGLHGIFFCFKVLIIVQVLRVPDSVKYMIRILSERVFKHRKKYCGFKKQTPILADEIRTDLFFI